MKGEGRHCGPNPAWPPTVRFRAEVILALLKRDARRPPILCPTGSVGLELELERKFDQAPDEGDRADASLSNGSPGLPLSSLKSAGHRLCRAHGH